MSNHAAIRSVRLEYKTSMKTPYNSNCCGRLRPQSDFMLYSSSDCTNTYTSDVIGLTGLLSKGDPESLQIIFFP